MKTSPYANKKESEWKKITQKLVNKHPLKNDLVDVVLSSWKDILKSKLGSYRIGKEIFPQPQIMGFFLHELIPLYLQKRNKDYRIGCAGNEKDVVCKSDDSLSIEIKTSSNPDKVFGNRSFARPQPKESKKKKDKNGFYLTINFEKFDSNSERQPEIKIIRFGYLELTDWKAQNADSGQQSSLSSAVYETKFVTLYDKSRTLEK